MVMCRLFGYAVFLSCVIGLQVDLPADPFSGNFAARGPVHNPRMLVMRGCSGSSAVMVFARNLLRYHGIPVPRASLPVVVNGVAKAPLGPGWPAELLNPKYNWFLSSAAGNMGKAMEMANAEMMRTNRTLFFKGMVQNLQGDGAGVDQWESLKPSFQKLDMFAVIGTRVNMLDEVICQVKDCFHPADGVPVDARGKESDVCFNRRGDAIKHPVSKLKSKPAEIHTRAEVYKAKLNVRVLHRLIDKEYELIDGARESLESIGIFPKTVTEEDLLDFQTPMPGAFKRAVTAWSVLLESLGVTPDEKIVREFLKQYRGTYHDKPTHADTIYNFHEVKAALQNTEYAHLIRE
eukprot:TRINITY_DN180_c0_g1_i12.p1 TRINITY_DN180_c0_g1~~TRINITY_DN180_c0_g1_i12.p1  ORF type:complete len:369 (-),score=51.92 TRINITY_DN180_c0_g1_i12:174-1217(-)